ncbi:MAG: FAD:protein FMN transferase [Pirellulaceae bacterium]|nr:FAD:protein FMN transferase [Pirellulaceae bacterium]
MDPGLLTTLTHRAMATEFAVMLPACEAPRVDAVLEALEMLDSIEAALTVYRDDSEISQVNQRAAAEPVRVSSETFDLLEKSLRWSRLTDGAFDITAGPLVQAWGFMSRSGRKPSDEEIQQANARVGYQNLILDHDRQTVRFAKPGMAINLGAIGKGDALDRLAARLTEKGLRHFLLHGGQSSVLARGDQQPIVESDPPEDDDMESDVTTIDSAGTGADKSESGNAERFGDKERFGDAGRTGRGWAIGISHPTKPQRRVGGIWLRDAALATSGSGKQFFHHQGRRYGHVIDPRTGYPAGDLLSLTVVTDSAADADACATGFFVAGSDAITRARKQALESEETSFPKMLGIRAGKRQDEVHVVTYGDLDWVDAS